MGAHAWAVLRRSLEHAAEVLCHTPDLALVVAWEMIGHARDDMTCMQEQLSSCLTCLLLQLLARRKPNDHGPDLVHVMTGLRASLPVSASGLRQMRSVPAQPGLMRVFLRLTVKSRVIPAGNIRGCCHLGQGGQAHRRPHG